MENISARLKTFLKLEAYNGKISFDVLAESDRGSYRELLIQYRNRDRDREMIPAYLLMPKTSPTGPAVLIHHQHNGERHLGKSEVVGKKGNPLQAFGPALAERGFVVLAPDSICFEDRRHQTKGTEPDAAHCFGNRRQILERRRCDCGILQGSIRPCGRRRCA